jgi:hypothetical protein
MNKLAVLGSGNEGSRSFFIFEKNESFFSLFPLFLSGCGFKKIGVYESYQDDKPSLNKLNNRVENFKNENYDIDVIYTQDRIILLVRTDSSNREKLIAGIERMANFK